MIWLSSVCLQNINTCHNNYGCFFKHLSLEKFFDHRCYTSTTIFYVMEFYRFQLSVMLLTYYVSGIRAQPSITHRLQILYISKTHMSFIKSNKL